LRDVKVTYIDKINKVFTMNYVYKKAVKECEVWRCNRQKMTIIIIHSLTKFLSL